MMRIGLIDVDGHNFPNLALMRISAYHKSIGDEVDWWQGNLIHYDIVYKSKIFSDQYSRDTYDVCNADEVIKGGSGYQIHLENGKEIYDKETDKQLPECMEKMFPDYSIYPQFDFAVAMTSRGCPRGCAFCHVAAKEGRCSVKVADVKDFWNGQKKIEVLDPNITACRDKRDLFQQYKETKAKINFSQGLDIRCINEEDINDIKQMKIYNLHFAWDNPNVDLRDKFIMWDELYGKKDGHGHNGTVYCLTNFEDCSEEDHIERALHRIYFLRDHGYAPYVMIYNKTNAPKRIRQLQRWCNNRFIFYKTLNFNDYHG